MPEYKFSYIVDNELQIYIVTAPCSNVANNKFLNYLLLNNIVQREYVGKLAFNKKQEKKLAKKRNLDLNLNLSIREEINLQLLKKGKSMSSLLSEPSKDKVYNL